MGYTAMPNRRFTSDEAFLSQDKLAALSLPQPSSLNSAITMAPQGAMFVTNYYYDYEDWTLRTCPFGNYTGIELCPYSSVCGYAEDPGAQYNAPSVMDSIWFLFTLSVIYIIFAAYWSSVFDKANGKGERFYFFLLPEYWLDNQKPETSEGNACVVIEDVSKVYGNFEALKGVSFKMNAGEVTALLGHNGAGKSDCVVLS